MATLDRARAWTYLALLLASFTACTTNDGVEIDAQSATLDIDPRALARGRTQLLVDGILAAENLLFSKDGRLFVSGDDGIAEIVRDASGVYGSQPLITGAPCAFGGMFEHLGVLYANCYDFSDSKIYAASLGVGAPVFRAIYTLPGVALANGLSGDDAGNLYVAATFLGQILRLRISASDPFAISAQDVWLGSPGLFVNGLKYHSGALYWTDFASIKTAEVRSDGRAGRVRSVFTDWTIAFYDDLFVDDTSIIAASYLAGGLRTFDLRGFTTGNTRAGVLDGPSSVLPTNGRLDLPSGALIVTERNANRVSLFIP
jgi:hypothetical protein